jgi:hypothetical protein
VVARVVGWLRAGYPDGVPQQDYVALLGILHRQLTEEEIVAIAQTLARDTETDVEERIRDAIRRKTLQPATDDEVARVSARLAGVGWPLAMVDTESPAEAEAEADHADEAQPTDLPAGTVEVPVDATRTTDTRPWDSETRRSTMLRLVAWVRQGYPTGVPAADFVPLVALLSRRLTTAEVADIVVELRGAGVVPSETGRIGAAIMGTTKEVPSIEEIERVRHHLGEMTGTDFSEG